MRPTSTRTAPHPAAAARAISRLARADAAPRIGIVLGSGFARVAEAIPRPTSIPFHRIPGFSMGSVPGHSGQLVLGAWEGQDVAVLSGRAHFYEGFDWPQVTFGVRVLAELGVQELLLTNAAGGIQRGWKPGDFMAITDHINLMGGNPLRGPVAGGRERFVDMTQAYEPALIQRTRAAARLAKVRLRSGVYLAVPGPSFETPAEIRAFARLGADAVGMSTAPETIVARQCGLRVAGLSCITNVAAGLAGPQQQVTHAEVLDVGRQVAEQATRLVAAWVRLSEPRSVC
ncbi:MAG: purine-nucleoside phosphorylase [Verrucomicrobiota bacterium]